MAIQNSQSKIPQSQKSKVAYKENSKAGTQKKLGTLNFPVQTQKSSKKVAEVGLGIKRKREEPKIDKNSEENSESSGSNKRQKRKEKEPDIKKAMEFNKNLYSLEESDDEKEEVQERKISPKKIVQKSKPVYEKKSKII